MGNKLSEAKEYFVIQSEYATGIVLNPDREWNLNNSEYRLFFRTEKEAMSFAYKTVNDYPEIECTVKRADGKLIAFLDKNGLKK